MNKISKWLREKAKEGKRLNDLDEACRFIRKQEDEIDKMTESNNNLTRDFNALSELSQRLKSELRDLKEFREQKKFEVKPSRKLVYICSPLRGNVIKNKNNAKRYCKQAIKQGVIPIAPHIYFTQFLNDKIEKERKIGMESAIELLKICDELWVFGKPSAGMQKEIEWWELNTNKKIRKGMKK